MKHVGTPEQRLLATRIAAKVVRRLPGHVPAEDIHQAALIGLWKALQGSSEGFSPEQLRCYLFRRIYGAIIDELRGQSWFSRYSREHKQLRFMRQLVDEHLWLPDSKRTAEQQLVDDGLVGYAMDRLDDRCRDVVLALFEGHKQKDIARWYKVSDARVSQLYRDALEAMRSFLDAEAREVPSR